MHRPTWFSSCSLWVGLRVDLERIFVQEIVALCSILWISLRHCCPCFFTFVEYHWLDVSLTFIQQDTYLMIFSDNASLNCCWYKLIKTITFVINLLLLWGDLLLQELMFLFYFLISYWIFWTHCSSVSFHIYSYLCSLLSFQPNCSPYVLRKKSNCYLFSCTCWYELKHVSMYHWKLWWSKYECTLCSSAEKQIADC